MVDSGAMPPMMPATRCPLLAVSRFAVRWSPFALRPSRFAVRRLLTHDAAPRDIVAMVSGVT